MMIHSCVVVGVLLKNSMECTSDVIHNDGTCWGDSHVYKCTPSDLLR